MRSNRRDAMDEAIIRMRFGMTTTEAQEQGVCVKCKQPVLPLDNLVISHYRDSALCESCSSINSP
jgi:hypothetical protein